MSILDDAIREHLELRRRHGADEAELKRLEDEAFGPPGRPGEGDPFAEAPTEFMAQPEVTEAAEAAGEESRRRIDIADLQEPPEAPVDSPQGETEPPAPAEDAAQAAPPAEEEQPAIEHEVVPEPEDEDRQAIAEQPTELFDVEAEIGTEDSPAAAPSPSDEEIVEAELAEPKLTPVEPASEIHASRAEPAAGEAEEEYEEDEEFWSEQRLSDELDQALEAPVVDEAEDDDGAADDHDELEPESGHDDVLEDTPDFLEDAPEDDELWFEQKPPKDFDFDD